MKYIKGNTQTIIWISQDVNHTCLVQNQLEKYPGRHRSISEDFSEARVATE